MVLQIFDEMDWNGDGVIDRAEWRQYTRHSPPLQYSPPVSKALYCSSTGPVWSPPDSPGLGGHGGAVPRGWEAEPRPRVQREDARRSSEGR